MFGILAAFTGLWALLPFVSKDMRLDFVGVVIFVMIGAISYFIGLWLDKRIPPEKTKAVTLDPTDISFITNALRKQKRTLLILSMSLFAFDALILFVVTKGSDDEKPSPPVVTFFLVVIMLLFVVVATMFLYKSIKLWNTREINVCKKLTKSPHLIKSLTAYFIQKADAPGKFGLKISVEVVMENEKLDQIFVTEEQLSLLRQYVQLFSPRALYNEKK